MDNVISFRDRSGEDPSPWRYVVYRWIAGHGLFEVAAWSAGGSMNPDAKQLLLGTRATIREAAAFAHAKAAQLGVPQVIDLTDADFAADDGGDAA